MVDTTHMYGGQMWTIIILKGDVGNVLNISFVK